MGQPGLLETTAHRVDLSPGDTLSIITDGCTEEPDCKKSGNGVRTCRRRPLVHLHQIVPVAEAVRRPAHLGVYTEPHDERTRRIPSRRDSCAANRSASGFDGSVVSVC